MTATRDDIKHWIGEAQKRSATHLIIALDQYDYDNYPIYINSDEDVRTKLPDGSNMQGYDEVYSFTGKHTIVEQLAERRAIHFD